MKGTRFSVEIDNETGFVRSIVMNDDPHEMNWCREEHPWGAFVVQTGHNRNFRKELTLVSYENGVSVYENEKVRITVSRGFDADGAFTERYVFRNIYAHDVFFRKGEIGIATPFCDEYKSSLISQTTRCNAHVWCGDEIAWVNALRQGESAQNLGLVLTDGALEAYGIRIGARSTRSVNGRGEIVLLPALPPLLPGEEYAVSWKLFIHSGTEDFFKKLTALGRNIDIRTPYYTYMQGEHIRFDVRGEEVLVTCDGKPVSTEKRDGRAFVEYIPTRVGEHIFRLTVDGRKTRAVMFVTEPFETLLQKRIDYIVDKQQYHNPKSELDGAYLVYDTKTERIYYDEVFHDHNAGRERLGMGLLIARYLQTHGNRKFYDSLMQYVAFVKRQLIDLDTGYVYDGASKDLRVNRRYNAPWMMQFMAELYRLTKDREYLNILVKIIRNWYENGGAKFYPNAVDIRLLHDVLAEANMPELAEVDALFAGHVENMLQTGLDYPPHEVIFEQTIVTPAVTFICEMGEILHDPQYAEKVRAHIAVLQRFNGMQPDYRFFGMPIRYWDDYWFGKSGIRGDTLHYWSCLTANSDYRYSLLSGSKEHKAAADACIRNCLALFLPDGSASCAYMQPYFIDEYAGEYYDDWANDQDFALYYALLLLA